MTSYIIQNNGALKGATTINGSKNAALSVLAATILTKETCFIHNVPMVKDVENMIQIMKQLGSKITINQNTLVVNNEDMNIQTKIPYCELKRLRASYYLLGACLTRFHEITLELPGGSDFGPRPMNLHFDGLKLLGADIQMHHSVVEATASKLEGARILFNSCSVGATINLLLASVQASGITSLINTAIEPQVKETILVLNKMGAKIKDGGRTIQIKGVSSLHGFEHTLLGDEIEAGTLLLAGIITKGNIELTSPTPIQIAPIAHKLQELGASILYDNTHIHLAMNQDILPTFVTTGPFPSFPTNLQPQIAITLGLAKGTSVVTENVFYNRFMYINEITRMGANMRREQNTNAIQGIKQYSGAIVRPTNAQDCAALFLAGLNASESTIIADAECLYNSYESLDEKLSSLGANIIKE